MSKRKKAQEKARARTPTIKDSGYSDGAAGHSSGVLKAWNPRRYSAKTDIDANLHALRNRSADQAINTPIGAAAITTSAMHTIGAGLKAFPRVKHKILGITPELAREWSRRTLEEFNLWAASKECDIGRRNSFYDLQDIVYTAYLTDGDAFALFRRKPPTLSMPYSLRLQVLEGNRISNPMSGDFVGATTPDAIIMDAPTPGHCIISGIELDADGAVDAYWVSNKVPGDPLDLSKWPEWQRVKAFGGITNAPNMLQICHDVRPGQVRGVPYLAPVLESLKQLSRYTTAELAASIVRSFFALFFTETPTGAKITDVISPAFGSDERDPLEPVLDPSEYSLGPGTMNALPKGVDVKSVDASNAQSTFDAFTTQIIKQIGAAIGQPYEVLMKSFTSSYSASRAALLQAWEEYKLRRVWFARDFCQPVYETWLTEAVAMGRIAAPGFFADPLIRAAWCNADWFGPTMSILDPVKDAQGSQLRVAQMLSTNEKEAAEMTGLDFEENIEQLAYEKQLMEKHGLASVQVPLAGNGQQGEGGGEDDEQVLENQE